jgi:hypothetical protein
MSKEITDDTNKGPALLNIEKTDIMEETMIMEIVHKFH